MPNSTCKMWYWRLVSAFTPRSRNIASGMVTHFGRSMTFHRLNSLQNLNLVNLFPTYSIPVRTILIIRQDKKGFSFSRNFTFVKIGFTYSEDSFVNRFKHHFCNIRRNHICQITIVTTINFKKLSRWFPFNLTYYLNFN